MATVTIVGAGMMGTAMAWPLSDNEHDVRLVGTHLDTEIIRSCREARYHPKLKRELPSGVRPYYLEELPEAIKDAEIILSGVNSLGVHWIGRTIGPYVRPGHVIIAITKGLEATANGELMILPDVLYNELPAGVRHQIEIAAVGGPCIAGELAGRRPTCVVFGSRHRETTERLKSAFQTDYYHIWTTTDLLGLEYGAAFKNAYTLGVGLAAGLLEKQGGVDKAGAHMHNLEAAILAQACIEMGRLMKMVGATQTFACGLPGVGDLFVTVQGGRTMRLGYLLGAGHSFEEAREIMKETTLESAEIIRNVSIALPKLTERGLIGFEELPLLRTLVDVLVHNRPVNIPLEKFFGGQGYL